VWLLLSYRSHFEQLEAMDKGRADFNTMIDCTIAIRNDAHVSCFSVS
jgi:hypothetical protein